VPRRAADYPPPVRVREFVAAPEAGEDERIDVGVLFVGGGPAGIAGAIRLGQLLAEDPATAEALGETPIAVIDKGRVAGATSCPKHPWNHCRASAPCGARPST
jgi:electron-transferring-flavoprotein dehydrogenase